MKITVGTLNPAKIEAVREVLSEYPAFASFEVTGVQTDSGVSHQPKSLDETMRGAMNRAKRAWQEGGIAFGLESGLMETPLTRTGYMDICVCAIYDGGGHVHGISSAWECPPDMTKMMIEDGLDMTQACYKSGRTNDPNVGALLGVLGVLTGGRIDRKAYTKQAIHMAMMHLRNPMELGDAAI